MPLSHEALLRFIHEKSGVDPATLGDDTLLFSSKLVDSFAMVDLILFVERNCKIRIAPSEVRLENLDSIARILQFAATKMQADGTIQQALA